MDSPSVDVDWADLNETVHIKIADAQWELNIRGARSSFLALASIREFDWDSRSSRRAGVCAGAQVFWSSDGELATIMVGHDDETWDVAVTVPVSLVDDLVRQVGAL